MKRAYPPAMFILLVLSVQTSFGLQADFDSYGKVGFQDFVTLSSNFGATSATHPQGDANLDGVVDFKDLVIVSSEFGAEGNIMVHDEAGLNTILNGNGFLNGKDYVILAGAVDQFNSDLTIANTNAVVCFDEGVLLNDGVKVFVTNCDGARIVNLNATAEVEFSPGNTSTELNYNYGDDFGVVNVLDCVNVRFDDLVATNNRQYLHPFGVDLAVNTGDEVAESLNSQSSCALNIGRSTSVTLARPTLTSKGKSTLCVYGNSTVTDMSDATINGSYFVLNVGASNITTSGNSVFTSQLLVENSSGNLVPPPGGDSHSAILVSSSYNVANGQSASLNSHVSLVNVEFILHNGRPIVSGNTNDFSKVTTVTLSSPKIRYINQAHRGILRYHRAASNSIIVNLTGSPLLWNGNANPAAYETPILEDFITTVNTDNYSNAVVDPGSTTIKLGKFVNYDSLLDLREYVDGQTTTFSAGQNADTIDP